MALSSVEALETFKETIVIRMAMSRPSYRGSLRFLVSLLLVGLSQACRSVPQHSLSPQDIRPLPYSTGSGSWPAHIIGIRERMQLANDRREPLRILAVHGMLTDSLGFSDSWQRSIADGMSLDRGGERLINVVRGYDIVPFSGPQPYSQVKAVPSQIRITEWMPRDGSGTKGLLFYELFWAPYRDVLKKQFFACFDSRSISKAGCEHFSDAIPNTDRRVLANRILKDKIVIGGLSDAAIVIGPMGDVIRDDVDLSMCIIARDVLEGRHLADHMAQAERCDLTKARSRIESATTQVDAQLATALGSTPFVVITHSLGSFLIMDGQIRADSVLRMGALDDRREALAFSLMDQATVFMYANQIPLLQLGRITPMCVPLNEANVCPNKRLSTASPAEPFNKKLTTYVGFNDTNDLLDFEIPPYFADEGLFGLMVNVSVSNPAFRIPGFHEPDASHVKYGVNPAIVKAVVDGIDLPKVPARP